MEESSFEGGIERFAARLAGLLRQVGAIRAERVKQLTEGGRGISDGPMVVLSQRKVERS